MNKNSVLFVEVIRYPLRAPRRVHPDQGQPRRRLSVFAVSAPRRLQVHTSEQRLPEKTAIDEDVVATNNIHAFGLARALYSIEETSELLSLGKTKVYALIGVVSFPHQKSAAGQLFPRPE